MRHFQGQVMTLEAKKEKRKQEVLGHHWADDSMATEVHTQSFLSALVKPPHLSCAKSLLSAPFQECSQHMGLLFPLILSHLSLQDF